jgi:hypothetical protein
MVSKMVTERQRGPQDLAPRRGGPSEQDGSEQGSPWRRSFALMHRSTCCMLQHIRIRLGHYSASRRPVVRDTATLDGRRIRASKQVCRACRHAVVMLGLAGGACASTVVETPARSVHAQAAPAPCADPTTRPRDPLGELADSLVAQLARNLPEGQTVAVLPFHDESNEVRILGRVLSDAVALRLSKEGVGLVERDRVADVYLEIERGSSEYVDDGKALTFGRMSGAQAVLLGTITRLRSGHYRVSARLVETETTSRQRGGAEAVLSWEGAEPLWPEPVRPFADVRLSKENAVLRHYELGHRYAARADWWAALREWLVGRTLMERFGLEPVALRTAEGLAPEFVSIERFEFDLVRITDALRVRPLCVRAFDKDSLHYFVVEQFDREGQPAPVPDLPIELTFTDGTSLVVTSDARGWVRGPRTPLSARLALHQLMVSQLSARLRSMFSAPRPPIMAGSLVPLSIQAPTLRPEVVVRVGDDASASEALRSRIDAHLRAALGNSVGAESNPNSPVLRVTIDVQRIAVLPGGRERISLRSSSTLGASRREAKAETVLVGDPMEELVGRARVWIDQVTVGEQVGAWRRDSAPIVEVQSVPAGSREVRALLDMPAVKVQGDIGRTSVKLVLNDARWLDRVTERYPVCLSPDGALTVHAEIAAEARGKP